MGEVEPSREQLLAELVRLQAELSHRNKRAEVSHQSEQFYRTLAQSFPNGSVLVFDRNLRFSQVEGSNFLELPVTKEKWVGQSVKARLPQSLLVQLEPLFQQALAGKPNNLELGRGDQHYTLRIMPVSDSQNEITAGMVLTTNITGQFSLQQALQDAQTRLRTVLINAPVALFGLNGAGQITVFEGKTASSLTLIVLPPVDGWLGRSIYEVFKDLPPALNVCQRMLEGEPVSEMIEVGPYFLEVFGTPQFDSNGKVIAANGLIIDVTARQQAEEELRKSEERLRLSQRMEAVGRLAGGIAHDFNNLLSAILGYTGLISLGLPPDSELQPDVSEIEKAAEKAAALTRQLLAFSRRQVLQPEVLTLNGVVQDMDKLLRRLVGENIEMRLYLQPEAGRVRADPSQIEQVVLNLVVNARDAMKMGGRLILETSNVELTDEYADRHVGVRPGPYVLLTVSDTGHGIDAATQLQIFEPFFTTKETGQGTGLGLSTVYGIIKQSGGNIWVYSEVGLGTTFKVYLPRVDAPLPDPRVVTANSNMAQTGSETILLVEDDEAVRTLAQKILERQGYRVLAANGGVEALEICQHQASIDLLLTDVVMPKINGQELARQITFRYPTIRVIFMSGYTYSAVTQSGVLEPETAFIQKPFTSDLLALKVRQVLDRPPVLPHNNSQLKEASNHSFDNPV